MILLMENLSLRGKMCCQQPITFRHDAYHLHNQTCHGKYTPNITIEKEVGGWIVRENEW
jgi:hypothetical protein